MPQSFDWSRALDAADKIVKIGAILVGGVWAYYKLIKGRLFRPRLEPVVSGEIFSNNDADYLIAVTSLKNVGASKVLIEQTGTALRVFGSLAPPPRKTSTAGAAEVERSRLVTLSVFTKHRWVESLELIQEKSLVALPKGLVAVDLELRVVGHGLEWNARSIVPITSDAPRSSER